MDCGWKKTVAPKSDALMPGEYFIRCPVCESEAIRQQPASYFEILWGQILSGRNHF
jgi:hypothetical protein